MKPNLKLVPRKKPPVDWRNVLAWGGTIALSAAIWWAAIFYLAPILAGYR